MRVSWVTRVLTAVMPASAIDVLSRLPGQRLVATMATMIMATITPVGYDTAYPTRVSGELLVACWAASMAGEVSTPANRPATCPLDRFTILPTPTPKPAISNRPTTPASMSVHWRLRSDRKVEPAARPTV